MTFNDDGLVPAIAQSAEDGAILMVAWMNRETLEKTLQTGEVTYWSRSRREVWRKGGTSGHTQHLVEALIDCDGDALLLKVDQIGPACHTGAPRASRAQATCADSTRRAGVGETLGVARARQRKSRGGTTGCAPRLRPSRTCGRGG